MYCNELNHIKSKENFSEVWLSLAELVGWPTLVTSGQVGHLIIILGGQSKAKQYKAQIVEINVVLCFWTLLWPGLVVVG